MAAAAFLIAAGCFHSCATIEGNLKCWGGNADGQLGYNHTSNVLSPLDVDYVPVGGEVSAVAAGCGTNLHSHTCVLLAQTNHVKCWGYNMYGQLGYNHTDNVYSPADLDAIPVGDEVTAIACGGYHTCVLLQSGSMKCWGNNMHGQLGYNHTDNVYSPASVDYVPLGEAAIGITAGHMHTCVLFLSQTVQCWGANLYAQLGYNHKNDILLPHSIETIYTGPSPVQGLAAGSEHTCTLSTNGEVKCWGYNAFGQLGVNNSDNVVFLPSVPNPIRLSADATGVFSGPQSTCALLFTGAVQCWGCNVDGQLGYNHTVDVLSPADDVIPLHKAAVAVAVGYRHTCAVLANGGIKCWGYNGDGQLGLNNTDNVLLPALADDVYVFPMDVPLPSASATPSPTPAPPCVVHSVLMVSAGHMHTCILMCPGNIKCWGSGNNGRLGYNDTVGRISADHVNFVPIGGLATAVIAGYAQTCAIMTGGKLKCWGSNHAGQLGYAHRIDVLSPADVDFVPVGADVHVTTVVAGDSHTCILSTAGAVKCWGSNWAGQLGYGSTVNVNDAASASNVPVGEIVTAIAAGAVHTCVVVASGYVKCWGYNSEGQLGYNHTADVFSPADVPFVHLENVTAVAAGRSHTCVLDLSRAVKCWGGNDQGQLGYNHTFAVRSPLGMSPVPVGAPVTVIAAAAYFTCALTLAGHVTCWGDGRRYQLGYGDTMNVLTPADVGWIPLGVLITGITAGTGHVCVLVLGGARCWGWNEEGQLGYGNTLYGTSAAAARDIPLFLPSPSTSRSPSAIATHTPSATARGLDSATVVATSHYHTCAILNKRVKCWGQNARAQLGYNHTNNVHAPAGEDFVPLGDNVTQIATGHSHTCAIVASGNVKCWGDNTRSNLGYGLTSYNINPEDVGSLPSLENVIVVGCGYYHSCALLSNGSVKCWGVDRFGQLGYGNATTITSTSDVGYVDVGGNVSAIAVGSMHTCALLSNGSIKCWGANSFGALGYNQTLRILSPADVGVVPIVGSVVAISAGNHHTCALLSTGDIKCWGGNSNGELGYGNTETVLSPAEVGTVSIGGTAKAVVAGADHTCALLAIGDVKCWGLNDHGQLGNNDTITLLSPAEVVPIGTPVVALAAGVYHTCALLAYGGIRCWGGNDRGQLGSDTAGILVLTPSSTGDVVLVGPSGSPLPTRSVKAVFATMSASVPPTWSITASPTPATSSLASPSVSPITSTRLLSNAPSPTALATRVAGAREARVPTLRLMALSASAYGSDLSVVRWMNGGDVPSQSSLAALWQQGADSNATNNANDLVVMSDALPPTLVLVSAMNELQDYTGIRCQMSGSIQDFTNDAYTRVHSIPWSLYSYALSPDLNQHFHAFLLSGERSLLALDSPPTLRTGLLECSPVFPSLLYIPQYPSLSLLLLLRPALWAVPRGVIVQSGGRAMRFAGAQPPACFETSHNTSLSLSHSLWHSCSTAELVDYVRMREAVPVAPEWYPASLDLNGATDITFILQLTSSLPDIHAKNIFIGIGNAICTIIDAVVVINVMFVRCISPSFDAACKRSTGTAECAPQRLLVQVGGSVDFASLEAVLRKQLTATEDIPLLPTLLRCEPFCDLLGTPTKFRTLIRDTSIPASNDGSVAYDVSAVYAGTMRPVAVLISSPRLQKRPPVTYLDVCIGYTNPLSGACMNASLPDHINCAFGGGSDCRPCPRGAMCPGGYRAIPKQGFWAASASTGSIVECAPPAERCLGWDLVASMPICAEGYAAHSPGCGWCAEGYFKRHGSGECSRCPSTEDPWVIIRPMLLLIAVVLGIVCAFMAIVWIVVKVFGGTMQGGMRRTVDFASAVFQSIQLVSTVTSAAGSALPSSMQAVVNVLNALQVQGILVDEACMQHQDPYIRVYVLSGLALLLATALLFHSLLVPKTSNALQIGGSKVLALFFACYGLVAQTVMSAYQCTAATIPLRSALPTLLRESDAGQSALAANDVHVPASTLSTCDANEFMDECGSLRTLLSVDLQLTVTRAYGRTDLCGGSAHASALGLAVVAFILALLTIPLALLIKWRKRRAANNAASKAPATRRRVSVHSSPVKPAALTAHGEPSLHIAPVQKGGNAPDAFDIFLQNQRYIEAKAYWWQLDCLLLLTVGIAVHAMNKPSTLLGIWLQTAVVCSSCAMAMVGKIFTRPYKPENFHLYIATVAIQAYSVLIQLLTAISYSARLPDSSGELDGYRLALGPWSMLCIVAALLLLIVVAFAFLYSLVGGAVIEQRDIQCAPSRHPSEMTHNPLLASGREDPRSKRVIAELDVESGANQQSDALSRGNMRTVQGHGSRQGRSSVARHLAPMQLRRANRSGGRGDARKINTSFAPIPTF